MTLACESHDTVSASDPPPDRSRRFRRGAPPKYPAAHLRWAKRRSVFFALGTPDHLATYGSGLRLRPGVRHERRRDGSAPRLEWEGPHDLRLLLCRRPPHFLCDEGACRRGVPAASRLLQGIRVGVVQLRHLRRECGWQWRPADHRKPTL